MKKSSLRNSGDKSRRKRVSLVVDDQIVLPADQVPEASTTPPSETTASSTSNSVHSLDDVIDPLLLPTHPETTHTEHFAQHHSLPRPSSTAFVPRTTSSPSNADSNPLFTPLSSSATTPPIPMSTSPLSSPPLPQSSTTTPAITNSTHPIQPFSPPSDLLVASDEADSFHTYVGGIHGSGVDDLDQTGSLGYPSSLGASYMEKYMQNRPMSVRLATVERTGMDGSEKEEALGVGVGLVSRTEEGARRSDEKGDHRRGKDHEREREREEDDMDIMGDMEEV